MTKLKGNNAAKGVASRIAASVKSAADALEAIGGGGNDIDNILGVDLPEHLCRRICTGVSFVDECFSGGLVPTEVVLFKGGPGAGKSTLSMQVADSLTGRGRVVREDAGNDKLPGIDGVIVLYVGNEEAIVQMRKAARRLNLKHGFVPMSDTMMPRVLQRAEELMLDNPTKQLVLIVDSLQTMNDGYYKDGGVTSATPLRVAKMVKEFCISTWAVALLISQVGKGGEFLGKNGLKHQVDGLLGLAVDDRVKSETYGLRLLGFDKHRFGQSGRAFVLDMSANGAGLVEKGDYMLPTDDE
jgi:DNA repair protein RadA/Sms